MEQQCQQQEEVKSSIKNKKRKNLIFNHNKIDFVYLSYLHPLFGFSFIWGSFFCIKSGTIAIMSLIFARYLGSIILSDLDLTQLDYDYRIKLLAISAVILVTSVNILGASWVSKIQRIFLFCKFFAIFFVLLMAFYFVLFEDLKIAKENFEKMIEFPELDTISLYSVLFYIPTFGAGIVTAIWAYSGFNCLNMVSEEIINPQQTIPISIITSLSIVIFCYLIANISYLLVLPIDIVENSSAIAIEMATKVWGYWAAALTSLLGEKFSIIN